MYFGDVLHRRRRPKAHKLSYRVFTLLLDLDEVEGLDRTLRLFGHNRRAVFSLHDADHGHGEKGGLKPWAEERLREAGLWSEGMRIAMLCYPRIFGYVFNPLTVYFCRSVEGELKAILYEVCNTFHERHTYVIPAAPNGAGTVRHECAKALYVSPFVPMECRYRFVIRPPAEEVLVAINEEDAEGLLLHAAFSGKRAPLDDRTLMRALFAYPLMTLKVMGAIHFEALRLWLKGVPFHKHHKAATPVARTIVLSEGGSA
jgi:DUF1365 family protein